MTQSSFALLPRGWQKTTAVGLGDSSTLRMVVRTHDSRSETGKRTEDKRKTDALDVSQI